MLQQAKMQAAVAAGPVSTGGVLLRLINTMIDMKMEKEVNESIFIISTINWQGTGEKKIPSSKMVKAWLVVLQR